MRQIKLRAHVGGHGMTKPFMIGDLCKHIPILTSDGIVDIRNNFNDPLMTLMQFTGIKDKRNVEIYEGDIVESLWQHSGVDCYDYVVAGEIIFDRDYCSFVIETIKNCEQSFYPLQSFYREELLEEGLEVIGNIHENPELLGRD